MMDEAMGVERFIVLLLLIATAVGCDDGGGPDASVDGGADGDLSDGDVSDSDIPSDSDVPDGDREPEPCEPLSTRTVPCARCGLASQSCGADGYWGTASDCLYQGECEAGESEVSPSPTCGEQQRLCDDSCQWREWVETTPGGECEAGSTREVAEGCGPSWPRVDTCSDACAWEEGPCESDNPCGGIRRVSPPLTEEICIPEGPFIRGDELFYADTAPVTEVFLSSYFIDRYPVTNERYRECLEAGVCPEIPEYKSAYQFPEYDRHPVQGASYEGAVAFCAWDGGRRLPTEAEWEKAARGPAPRDNPYVWGYDEEGCEFVHHTGCPGISYPSPFNFLPDEVDAVPGSASYYGVELLVGGGVEIISDYYGVDYYADPSSLVDPQGPETGDYRALRGTPRNRRNLRLTNRNVDRARSLPSTEETTFRCARSAPASE